MLQNKTYLVVFAMVLSLGASAQVLKLEAVIDSIASLHPVVKMYNSEIRSMDEAAKGARSWMPPQLGFGQFMTPYDVRLWHRDGDIPGMGFVMASGEQMIPNKKKLDADERYMQAMSAVEKEKKNATINELISDARQMYYEWVLLQKKIHILDRNEKLLNFIIKNAEIRYKNGLEKINAYYKAKAAIGSIQNMRLMFESDIREKRIRINSLMGRNAMIVFDVDTTIRFNDYHTLVFDSTLFYRQRSDLKAIDKDINLAYLKQETEKQNLRPQFGIRYDNMIGFGGQPMQYTLMGMVKIPMARWSSKMGKAAIESLKWKATALQSQKEMMANEFSGMAYGMRNELDTRKQQLSLYETKIIPALQNNFSTLQLSYEQNTEELFMLFDAWESLYMKEMEYTELLNQVMKLQVTLDRILEKR